MIRIDALWLGAEPVDMRWARQAPVNAAPMALSQAQFDALALGLPWQRLEQMKAISRM